MHTLSFTLKQHTPIIHFQHDQDGATLRATEVKPKLDQFLFEHLTGKTGFAAREAFYNAIFNGTDEEKERKLWLVGKDLKPHLQGNDKVTALRHMAFDYKLRIDSLNVTFPSANGYRLFFGNTGPGNQNKYKLSFSSNVTASIISTIKSLIDSIGENLCVFFANHNFGSRQSKGFGSFYPDSNSAIFNKYTYLPVSHPFKFIINSQNTKDVFAALELFYLSLRSGINRVNEGFSYGTATIDGTPKITAETTSRFYFKSLLFLYIKNHLQKQWEKKTIKEVILNSQWSLYGRKIRSNEDYQEISSQSGVPVNRINNNTRIHQTALLKQQSDNPQPDNCINYNQTNGQKYIFKDLFGLSTSESWGSYGFTIEKKHSRRDNNSCQTINDNDPFKISRFKSPLFFKIINKSDQHAVYFKVNPIPSNYGGEWFSIYKGRSFSLCLPVYDQFDFQHFFDWIFNPSNFSILTHVEPAMQNEEEFFILKNIYEQLQGAINHA
jgi:hypothetical protein